MKKILEINSLSISFIFLVSISFLVIIAGLIGKLFVKVLGPVLGVFIGASIFCLEITLIFTVLKILIRDIAD